MAVDLKRRGGNPRLIARFTRLLVAIHSGKRYVVVSLVRRQLKALVPFAVQIVVQIVLRADRVIHIL